MISECVVYRLGRRIASTPDVGGALATARRRNSSFVWITLEEPIGEDLDQIAGELGLPAAAVAASRDVHQRPRLEHIDESVLLVLKTLRYDRQRSAIEMREVVALVGSDYVVTVRQGRLTWSAGCGTVWRTSRVSFGSVRPR